MVAYLANNDDDNGDGSLLWNGRIRKSLEYLDGDI